MYIFMLLLAGLVATTNCGAQSTPVNYIPLYEKGESTVTANYTNGSLLQALTMYEELEGDTPTTWTSVSWEREPATGIPFLIASGTYGDSGSVTLAIELSETSTTIGFQDAPHVKVYKCTTLSFTCCVECSVKDGGYFVSICYCKTYLQGFETGCQGAEAQTGLSWCAFVPQKSTSVGNLYAAFESMTDINGN